VFSDITKGHKVGWLFGVTISIGIAALLTFLVRGTHRSVIIPIVFLGVIILCSRYFGLLAGILGSVLAASIFAFFLFEPYGSFQVNDHQALSNLGLLLFAGIALSYANAGQGEERPSPPSRLKPQ
jgi:K+-sensing histidine kinase KdpD